MNIGDFRHLFQVYRTADTKDRVGQPSTATSHLLSFYGSRLNWQNREQYEGRQLIESDIIVVRTFYHSDISVNDALIDELGKTYQIRGIKELGYRDFMEITAQYKSNRP